MGQPTKMKPWQLRPHDEALGSDTHAFLDWVQTSLNMLIGQQVPPTPGEPALAPSQIDPTTVNVKSAGSRTAALTTNFGFTAPSTTSVQIYWDGTNSSTVLRIYRDDGSVAGPFPGSQLVIGLTAATTYFFYPYFDEATGRVLFVSVSGAVGTPPIAYPAATIAVAQQQILRGRVQLAANLAVTGITTPAAGTTPATNAGGGGTGSGAYLGSKLAQ